MISFTLLARTGDRFAPFAPYAPSLDSRGRAAFQASLQGPRGGGGSGVYLADGAQTITLAESGDTVNGVNGVSGYVSHPDLDDEGRFAVYASLTSGAADRLGFASPGAEALLTGAGGRGAPLIVADSRAVFARIGPLGPTLNAAGAVAFRASTPNGGPGIFIARGTSITAVPLPAGLAEIHGLPVIDNRDEVAYRVDLADGTQAILATAEGRLITLADTTPHSPFASLSRFPCANASGLVSFAATRRDGSAGVFLASRGRAPEAVFEAGRDFASIRGALVDDTGSFVFIATPRGGEMGVYSASGRRLLGIGDACAGSVITEFALNPVSINGRGQLAARVALGDGGEAIGRLSAA